MASVESRTRISIDQLVNDTIVSGSVNSSGHLILTTRGGGSIDAGFIGKVQAVRWSSATQYLADDLVGYAGTMWKALANNLNKPPALFTDTWQRIKGLSGGTWSEKDSFFDGNVLTSAGDWDTATKTGTSTVSFTSVAGEFESGKQALKANLLASSSQRLIPREENIVRGGETVQVQVRAKLVSAAAGARLNAEMYQNDQTGNPAPGASGLTTVPSTEGAQALTTSFATYTFTLTTVNAKARAVVAPFVTTDATGSAVFVIDWIRITKPTNTALAAYPIDSVYISFSSANPSTVLGGGTWTQIAKGKTLVGVDPGGDPDFDTAGETGGSKRVTLTTSQMPAHDHPAGELTTQTAGVHTHVITRKDVAGNSSGVARGDTTAETDTTTGSDGDHAHNVQGTTGDTGGGNDHENMPPYITTYMWRRTA